MNATKLSTRDIDQHRDDLYKIVLRMSGKDGSEISGTEDDGEMLKRFIRTYA